MNPQFNVGMPGYEYRPGMYQYKGSGPVDPMIPPVHQSQQMYYENQQPLPGALEPNPYMDMMSVQGMEGYEAQSYYWREP